MGKKLITGNEPANARTGWMPTREDIKDMQQNHLEAVMTLPAKGLTIRQEFASRNQAAMLSDNSCNDSDKDWFAKKAIAAADALIEALNK